MCRAFVSLMLIMVVCEEISAGPFGKEIEGRIESRSSFAQAIEVSAAALAKKIEVEKQVDGASVVKRDAMKLVAVVDALESIARDKQWTREQKLMAGIDAWTYMRTGPEADVSKELDTDKMIQILRTYDYVEIQSMPPGARIEIEGRGKWDETDDDGFLPAGEATIILTKDGYATLKEKRTVESGKKNVFPFQLKPL